MVAMPDVRHLWGAQYDLHPDSQELFVARRMRTRTHTQRRTWRCWATRHAHAARAASNPLLVATTGC